MGAAGGGGSADGPRSGDNGSETLAVEAVRALAGEVVRALVGDAVRVLFWGEEAARGGGADEEEPDVEDLGPGPEGASVLLPSFDAFLNIIYCLRYCK